MSTRVRQFAFVALAQTGCLAVGLWMQHRFVTASTFRAVEEQVWSDIEVSASELYSRFEGTLSAVPGPAREAFEHAAQLLESHPARVGDVMIVDSQWRLIRPQGDAEQDSGPSKTPVPGVEWIADADAPKSGATSARCRLLLPDGPHIAVARALADGEGYLVVHHPMAAIESRAAALGESLPAISVMTLAWTCALLSIAVYMILARLHDDLDRERSQKTHDAHRQAHNLIRTRDAVIFGLAKLAESRDPETGDHLERISIYSTTLASELRSHSKFRDEVTPAFIRLIGISSALHDIGKVGVEDRVLLKPGRLTPEERVSMQVHTTIGGECLREIEQRLQGSNFLQMAREIAFAHHERWDGRGYPCGLAGTGIPLSARIVAIVDIYDALSSRRVYKDVFPHEKCVEIIRNEAGEGLDPDLVEVWLGIEHRFRSLAERHADSGQRDVFPQATELAGVENTETETDGVCVASSVMSSGKG